MADAGGGGPCCGPRRRPVRLRGAVTAWAIASGVSPVFAVDHTTATRPAGDQASVQEAPAGSPVAVDMVPVPAGMLRMGAADGDPSERPEHEVRVPAFRIDRRETTNDAFAAFVAATGHVTDAERMGWGWHWVRRWERVHGASWRHPHGLASGLAGLGDHPVVQVSWHDAAAYCAWRGARLPTEAEWERAARGAGDRVYAWGDEAPDAGGVHRASYGMNACCAAGEADGYRYTAPVGSFPAGRSPLGVDDLTGNVWEWVADGYAADYYARSPREAPLNDEPAAERVIRGGGWGNNPWGLRATLRHANRPRYALSMVGIRCADDH